MTEIYQSTYQNGAWSQPLPSASSAQWVIAFGSKDIMDDPGVRDQVRQAFPQAQITGCTTSGAIEGTKLYDSCICLTAATFASSRIETLSADFHDFGDSGALGAHLAEQLNTEGLVHIFVMSDGHVVNGSDLIRSVCKKLPDNIYMTGGLAGDGMDFKETKVWLNDQYRGGLVALICFYGPNLKVGKGNFGGWKPFGPNRKVTRSQKNVLYELDNKPALEIYKTYLGEYANELPGSALRFPIGLKHPVATELVVRTILSINEEDQSMVFAGNVPEGASCQIMHANYENLISGAGYATEKAISDIKGATSQLAILVSCVGRRMVLGVRTEEELEEVKEMISEGCHMAGFYSYGEISSVICSDGRCGLLNQTMTVTLFEEVG
ncbi:FIST C-terminal domain-containing protein [Hahella sp. CR1]|uniref:FIST signal transduction protein n=1 Tax=Hahella sp. CR1 TaxID=2992807 RepID=UPI00244179BC|nr:FIST N-terminal domain-containing protein [Hahella sp. CR1]MDG9672040.1 FIST C-terminal domain-containing protein [Hahella sp. CR1]